MNQFMLISSDSEDQKIIEEDEIESWSFEECESWLNAPINKPNAMGQDDSFDKIGY